MNIQLKLWAAALFVIALLALAGCASGPAPAVPVQQPSSPTQVSSVQDLVLSAAELANLGLTTDGCTFEGPQYGMCNYTRVDTKSEIITQLYHFDTMEDRNGSFDYNSGHLTGTKGIIEVNTMGDRSRFSRNADDDYGAEFNKDNTTYYHLWIAKDLYVIHVTSKGVESDNVTVRAIGQGLLAKIE